MYRLDSRAYTITVTDPDGNPVFTGYSRYIEFTDSDGQRGITAALIERPADRDQHGDSGATGTAYRYCHNPECTTHRSTSGDYPCPECGYPTYRKPYTN